jgi:ATP-dependent exoDNAse (exonuclease V) beta subunit
VALPLKDPSFEGLAAIDEQMGEQERRRLLYVATTRARDHLVVSLHRVEDKTTATPAVIIEGVGGAEKGAPYRFERDPSTASPLPEPERADPPPEYQTWLAGILRAREASRQKRAVTASGLEGTEPEVVWGEAEEGAAKAPRDLDLPPWSKGRYGSAVGRAVHGVLQVVDLSSGQGLQNAVRAQVLAEGLADHAETVNELVQSALASDIVRRAASREHWREAYVGAPLDGQLVEGIIDLLYREDDGSLVVVDYKTDVVSAPTLDAKVAFYRPQLDVYRRMLIATTGAEVTARLLFLHPGGSLLESP